MNNEEILNRLSDVIYFYSDSHKNPQNDEEKKEWNKNVKAAEIVEIYYSKNNKLK